MPFVRETYRDPQPAGVYQARLASVEEQTSSRDGGTYLRWTFTARGEGNVFVEISGLSSTRFGPQTKARQWAQALLGRVLTREEAVAGLELNELIGATCQLVVGIVEKESGTFNEITAVTAIDEESVTA